MASRQARRTRRASTSWADRVGGVVAAWGKQASGDGQVLITVQVERQLITYDHDTRTYGEGRCRARALAAPLSARLGAFSARRAAVHR